MEGYEGSSNAFGVVGLFDAIGMDLQVLSTPRRPLFVGDMSKPHVGKEAVTVNMFTEHETQLRRSPLHVWPGEDLMIRVQNCSFKVLSSFSTIALPGAIKHSVRKQKRKNHLIPGTRTQ